MKTSALLIIVVVMLHCAALGALFFIQGCGTTARTGTPPPATMAPMPPTTKEAVKYPPPKPSEKTPAVKSESKELPKALETTEYIVKSGDSIGSIAKQCGVSRSEIAELNKLTDPNKLRVGQKLMLPGRLKIKAAPAKHSAKAKAVETPAASAEVAASAEAPVPSALAAPAVSAPASADAVAAPMAGKEYIVQKGDVLSRIAKKCGTKVSALREANKLQSDKLKVGQKLVIPEAAAAPVAPVTAAPVVTPPVETKPAAPAVLTAPAALPVSSAPVSAVPAASAAPVAPTAPAASVTQVAAPAKPVASSGITHVVQQVNGKTEDLDSIAKLYVVTVDEIVEINQLGANRTLKVGQRLKIP